MDYDKITSPEDKALFVLEQFKQEGKSVLTAGQISTFLLKEFDDDVSESSIRMALLRAERNQKKKYVKSHDLGKKRVGFTIIRNGMKHLAALLERPLPTDPSDSSIPTSLISKLGPRFTEEFREYSVNEKYGCGMSQAFLLRKILEKSLLLAFRKNGFHEDTLQVDGKTKGLNALLNLATGLEVGNAPLLSPRKEKEIRGVKFLGDIAAHGVFSSVSSESITPQLPFIIQALEELAEKI